MGLLLRGTVQGVGLRPHVLRVASSLGVSGFVCNTGGEVEIEAQGSLQQLERFVEGVRGIAAPAALRSVARTELSEQLGEVGFRIRDSSSSARQPALPPDLAPCAECIAELEAPSGRRSGYAFTACTRCGPRFSIVQSLPYDRVGTTLDVFPLCRDCQLEYEAVADRRFHAQAMACPSCGPKLTWLDAAGSVLAQGARALAAAAESLKCGQIVALKGVGGFQLLVDADDDAAVARLRERKRREQKPFAVLLRDADVASAYVELSDAERRLLTSPEAPIVLAQRREQGRAVAASVAPDNPRLGCLLPASPLHHLLARAVERPLVCTSGNSSGEPLCIETSDALERLSDIADTFLVHDRAVSRPLDDSVVRLGPHAEVVLRRGRGYAPRVVAELPTGPCVLALGAELKAAPALLLNGALVLGQHVGDLGELRTRHAFERNVADLLRFFAAEPQVIACDLHPDYASTQLAEALAKTQSAPLVRVQHHHAHIAGVIAEHGLTGSVLGLAWDGTGHGTDGTVWGGEALLVDGARCERVARLPLFPLPGGDRAAREPWRSALGLLCSVDATGELARRHGQAWVEAPALETVLTAVKRDLNAPLSSSVGRLFDAVAALAGRPERIAFEGQAAMQLEFAPRRDSGQATYPLDFELLSSGAAPPATLEAFVNAVLSDAARGRSFDVIAGKFQRALVGAAVRLASRLQAARIVLSGGCFQNALLLHSVTHALEAAGHRVYTPRQVPPNDGGIAAGQAAVAAWSKLAAQSC
jgi:hydrogenase maturation protein HypF